MGNTKKHYTADHYAALGVSEKATGSDINKAFKKLMFEYHPDKIDNKYTTNKNSPEEKADRLKSYQVTSAYAILSDPETRRAYDEDCPYGRKKGYEKEEEEEESAQQFEKFEETLPKDSVWTMKTFQRLIDFKTRNSDYRLSFALFQSFKLNFLMLMQNEQHGKQFLLKHKYELINLLPNVESQAWLACEYTSSFSELLAIKKNVASLKVALVSQRFLELCMHSFNSWDTAFDKSEDWDAFYKLYHHLREKLIAIICANSEAIVAVNEFLKKEHASGDEVKQARASKIEQEMARLQNLSRSNSASSSSSSASSSSSSASSSSNSTSSSSNSTSSSSSSASSGSIKNHSPSPTASGLSPDDSTKNNTVQIAYISLPIGALGLLSGTVGLTWDALDEDSNLLDSGYEATALILGLAVCLSVLAHRIALLQHPDNPQLSKLFRIPFGSILTVALSMLALGVISLTAPDIGETIWVDHLGCDEAYTDLIAAGSSSVAGGALGLYSLYKWNDDKPKNDVTSRTVRNEA